MILLLLQHLIGKVFQGIYKNSTITSSSWRTSVYHHTANKNKTMIKCLLFNWLQWSTNQQTTKHCSNIAYFDVSATMFPHIFFEATKCFWKSSETFFVAWIQKLFLQQMFSVCANRETLGKQCFLVCRGFIPPTGHGFESTQLAIHLCLLIIQCTSRPSDSLAS